ncbi:MAG TPA: DUF5329 family protein [Burkholderiaceae bacterium]|nr:DUF5329 family protein [Burkholderiaceae bacterium]
MTVFSRRVCCLILLAAASVGAAGEPVPSEKARIDRLIDAVAQNTIARFVRNGSVYSSADAAEFLRQKLRAFGDRVKTVYDFIEHVASRSSTSGEIYKVRLADGREVPSGDFLRAELARIEGHR